MKVSPARAAVPFVRSPAFRIPLLLAVLAGSAAPSAAQAPPNIVVFMADDVGYGDVGPYDHDADPGTPPVSNTPVIDAQIAAAGVRLSDYYSGAAVCTPARAMMLTGRHNARLGITGVLNAHSGEGLASWETTLAEVLHARGYATAIIGKWHLGNLVQFQPLAAGFDAFYGVLHSNDMTPFCLQRDLAEFDCSVDQALLTQNFTAEAKTFVTSSVAQQRPFFLYLPYVAPHVPVYVSPAFDGATGRGLYADAVREIDDSVGQILARIAELGVANDTLVIFTSDNGPGHYEPGAGVPEPWRWVGGSAGPLRGWKGDLFEGGVRVPFLARWPGEIPAGLVSDEPVNGMDLFVTLAERAGVIVPNDRVIDGRDVWTILSGKGDVAATDFFFYKAQSGASYGMRELGAMRSGRWKLHFDQVAQDIVPADLYDLSTDVGETTPVNDAALKSQLADRARSFHCGLDDPLLAIQPSSNLALHQPVAASSSKLCNTSVDAVDGKAATYWESAPGDDQWLYVDLGAKKHVGSVVLAWGNACALHYRVEVSDDAQSWSTIYVNLHGNGGDDVVPVGQATRYVRLHGLMSSAACGYTLEEISVYRKPVP